MRPYGEIYVDQQRISGRINRVVQTAAYFGGFTDSQIRLLLDLGAERNRLQDELDAIREARRAAR